MKKEKIILILGSMSIVVIVLILINTSNVLAQTPTITATPKGTMTPYPTNNNLTPAPGSGCPTSMPENVTANWYKNCGVCFADYNPLATATPIVTHTPTGTSTPTPTPGVPWVGKGRFFPGEEVKFTSGVNSTWVVKSYSSSEVCGRSSSIVGASSFYHVNGVGGSYNSQVRFYGGDSAKQWSVGYYDVSHGIFPSDSSLLEYVQPLMYQDRYPYGFTAEMAGSLSGGYDKFSYGCVGSGKPSGWSCSFEDIRFYCLNSEVQTETPTPTPTLQNEVCVPETEYEVITSMESFSSGLKTVGDGKVSYYRIYPYDVGSYKSLYERDFYNKNFEINMELSNVSYFQFEKSEEDLDVFYGKHKISFYDCSDQNLGSYETNDEFDQTRSWTFSTATSLCRVVVETIDNGLEKQFSSEGVSSDGCKQINCYARSSLTDFYEEDSPFGIDMGSWGTTQCKLIFPGIDLSGVGDAMENAINFINIDLDVPDFPNIPWINLCVHYWYLPRIKLFDFEIPIGNILLIAILPSIFKSIGGRKSK